MHGLQVSMLSISHATCFVFVCIQGSKNRPSPIRLGRVVTASVLTELKTIPDTAVCNESVQLGINRLKSVNSAEFPS